MVWKQNHWNYSNIVKRKYIYFCKKYKCFSDLAVDIGLTMTIGSKQRRIKVADVREQFNQRGSLKFEQLNQVS